MHFRNINLLHQSKQKGELTLHFWIPPFATAPCGSILCQTDPCESILYQTVPCGSILCATVPCWSILCATAAAPCEVVLVQVKVTGNASLIGNHHHRLPLIPPNNLLWMLDIPTPSPLTEAITSQGWGSIHIASAIICGMRFWPIIQIFPPLDCR